MTQSFLKTAVKSVVFSATLFFSVYAFAADPVCRITHIEGDVTFKENKDADWSGASEGQELAKGYQVLTQGKSVCEIQLGDANALHLEENTLATVTSVDPALIDVSSGKIYALVRKLKQNSEFQVRTPTCIASARGTGWSQSDDAIEVFESTVSAKNKEGKEQDIENGKGISIDADSGAFGKSYVLPKESLDKWKKMNLEMLSHLKLYAAVSVAPAGPAPVPTQRKITGTANRTGAVSAAIGNIQMLMQRLEAKYRPFEEKIKDEVAEYDTVTENVAIGLKIYRKDVRFRGETNMTMPPEAGEPGMTMNVTLIYDGSNYWNITPMGTMKVPASQVQKQMQASEHWWNYLSERDTFAGEGSAEGRECYVVDLEPGKSLAYTRIWIDKENFRLIQAQGPEDGHQYRFTFSDYRDVQGMDLPFKMQMYEDERPVGEYITKSMQFNVGLSDDLFVVNAQGGGMDMQEMMRRAMKEADQDNNQQN